MEKRLVYVILFPDKRVFIGQTYKSIEEKIEYQKQDLNDRVYPLFKECPNPQILFEYKYFDSFKDVIEEERKLIKKYDNDGYKIYNRNFFIRSRMINNS